MFVFYFKLLVSLHTQPLATSISTQSESVQSSSVEAGFTDLEPFDFGTINKEPEVPKRDER